MDNTKYLFSDEQLKDLEKCADRIFLRREKMPRRSCEKADFLPLSTRLAMVRAENSPSSSKTKPMPRSVREKKQFLMAADSAVSNLITKEERRKVSASEIASLGIEKFSWLKDTVDSRLVPLEYSNCDCNESRPLTVLLDVKGEDIDLSLVKQALQPLTPKSLKKWFCPHAQLGTFNITFHNLLKAQSLLAAKFWIINEQYIRIGKNNNMF